MQNNEKIVDGSRKISLRSIALTKADYNDIILM